MRPRAPFRSPRSVATLAVAATLAALGVAAAPAASAATTVAQGFRLLPNQVLTSTANGYRLVMQPDGNLVQYSNHGVPLWSSGTAGRGPSQLVVQPDGNLVLRTLTGVATWSTNTHHGQRLAVQDDGNVVLYAGSSAAWCTCAVRFHRVVGTPATLTAGQGLLAGDALVSGNHKLALQGDGNLVVYGPSGATWTSRTSAGIRTYLVLQADGNLVLYGPDGRARWASNTPGRGARTLGFDGAGNLRLLSAAGTAVWSTAKGTPTGIAGDVFALLNRQRAAHGLPALTSDARLMASATRHNATMSAANTLSHQLPGEAVFSARITAAGYAWRSCAENIAYTTDATSRGAQAMQTAMYNETPPNDGHRLNILSRSLTQVGVAVLVDARGKLWLTTDFGLPR